jgi:hypothetical protein
MADTTTDSTDRHTSPRPDPWRIAWNILTSNELLGLTLLATALLLALAAWIPQAPDSASNPIGYSRWLAETRANLGSSFALWQQIGLFSLESHLALRVLLALAALALIVRLLEGIGAAWLAWRRSPVLSRGAAELASEPSLEEMATTLQARRLRVGYQGNTLYADRFTLSDAGSIALYLGALLVLMGLAISAVAGWRASNLTLGVGQATLVGHGTPYSIRLDSFDPTGAGELTLLSEADLIGTSRLKFGQPMHLAELSIFVSGNGPAIRASATLTDGQPLRLQTSATSAPAPELLLLLTRDEPDRYFAVPDGELVVEVSRNGGQPSEIGVQVYRSRTGAVITDTQIRSDEPLNVENTTLTFEEETYAVLDLVHDPGRLVAQVGMVMLALGLALAMICPAGRIAVATSSDGIQVTGDADSAQALNPAPGLATWRRVAAWIETRLGWAVLSVMAGMMVVRSMVSSGTLVPSASTAPALVAAWLVGCVAAILPHKSLKWAALALAVIAVAAVLIWPAPVFPTGL